MRINPFVDDPSPKAANVPQGNASFAPSWLMNEIVQCVRVPGRIRVMSLSFRTKPYHMRSGQMESAITGAVDAIISATTPPRESSSSSCISMRTGLGFGMGVLIPAASLVDLRAGRARLWRCVLRGSIVRTTEPHPPATPHTPPAPGRPASTLRAHRRRYRPSLPHPRERTKPTAARSLRAAATAWPGVLDDPCHGCPSAASPAWMRRRQAGRLMGAGASLAAAKAASRGCASSSGRCRAASPSVAVRYG